MIKVNSSNVEAIGYSGEDNTLKVQFKGGMLYEYIGVPESNYNFLFENKDVPEFSIGKYINRDIKPIYKVRLALTKEALEKELKKLKISISNKEEIAEGTNIAINYLVEKFELTV